jgi:hypothetical protein
MQNSWDRQLNESPKSFSRFAIYRDMGAERSLRKLADDVDLNLSTVAELSKKYRWQERAAAFDAYIDQASQISQLNQTKAMKRRQISLALKAQELAEKGLAILLRTFDDERINNIRPEGLSRLLDVACRLERLNRDQPEQTIEVTQTKNYDNLSLEEMETMRALLVKCEGPALE